MFYVPLENLSLKLISMKISVQELMKIISHKTCKRNIFNWKGENAMDQIRILICPS
jgi:hypothetical protein